MGTGARFLLSAYSYSLIATCHQKSNCYQTRGDRVLLVLLFRRLFSLITLTTLVLLLSLLLTQNAVADLLSVNPTEGLPGTKVTVTGNDWPPGDTIELSWNFPPFPEITSVNAAGDGHFNVDIFVPSNAPVGITDVNAINKAGDITWQAPFEITANTAPVARNTEHRYTIKRGDLWAGWSVRPKASPDGRVVIRSVSSSWIVPAVTCDDASPLSRPWIKSRAAVWVGILPKNPDPKNPSQWLVQIGTSSECFHEAPFLKLKRREFAWAQIVHGKKYPPYIISELEVHPDDIVNAYVKYYGRQSDGKLKFEAGIGKGRVSPPSQVYMLTDPGVSEEDAAWQMGSFVESEQDGTSAIVYDHGGLAHFTTPVTFENFQINQIAPELWLDAYSGYNNLFRWDLMAKRNGGQLEALAETGLPGPFGAFSVIWKAWR